MVFAGPDSRDDLIATLTERAGIVGNDCVILCGRAQGLSDGGSDPLSITLEGFDKPIPIVQVAYETGRKKSVFKSKHLFKNLNDPRLRAMVVLVVRLDDNGQPIATLASFVVTTPEWIPVESSHELRMAAHLVKIGYHFTKPLRKDLRWRYRHDFVLHLATGNYPIEVNGMRKSEAYCAHKKVVTDYLNSEYPNHHCSWWPELIMELTWLPQPSRQRQHCAIGTISALMRASLADVAMQFSRLDLSAHNFRVRP